MGGELGEAAVGADSPQPHTPRSHLSASPASMSGPMGTDRGRRPEASLPLGRPLTGGRRSTTSR